MSCERIEIDDNSFIIDRGGKSTDFYCVREQLADGRRGLWLLMRKTMIGPLIADRDQYSNDLLERVDIALDGRNPRWTYARKFKHKCTKAEYLANVESWLTDIGFQFGGDWTSEYHDWDGNAVLLRKEGT